jgi:DNA-binding transcriptional LysR family regulator
VRVWQRAQLEVSLSDQHRDHLAVGAPTGLWQGFLLKWVARLRTDSPDIAVSAIAAPSAVLTQRLIEGTLDLAVMYRPIQPPGHVVEHLFDEEFVLVTSAKQTSRRTASSDYVFVDWGPDFQQDHAAAYPELTNPGLHLDLGASSIEYLLANEASGYFPARLVKTHIARGRLRQPKRARRFVYPVYMVYPEARDEETYELIIHGLRSAAARVG